MHSYYSLLQCGHSAGPEAQFLCSVCPLYCTKDCPAWLSQDRFQLWEHQSPELPWIPCHKSLKPLTGLEDCREFCKSHPSPPPPLPIFPRMPRDILLIVTYKSGQDVCLGHHQSNVEAQGRHEHACGTDQRISFVVSLP